MIIGVPKEIKQQENRVSLLPSAAYQLTKRGHSVLVEKNAGVGTGWVSAVGAQPSAAGEGCEPSSKRLTTAPTAAMTPRRR
jgi:NAD/NADP transhydrogenase alpha subunit